LIDLACTETASTPALRRCAKAPLVILNYRPS